MAKILVKNKKILVRNKKILVDCKCCNCWGLYPCCECSDVTVESLKYRVESDLSAYDGHRIVYGNDIDLSPCYLVKKLDPCTGGELLEIDLSKIIFDEVIECGDTPTDSSFPCNDPNRSDLLNCSRVVCGCCFGDDAVLTLSVTLSGGTPYTCAGGTPIAGTITATKDYNIRDLGCAGNAFDNISFGGDPGIGWGISGTCGSYRLDVVTYVLPSPCGQQFLWNRNDLDPPSEASSCDDFSSIVAGTAFSTGVAVNFGGWTEIEAGFTVTDTGKWVYNPDTGDCEHITAP